MPATAKKDALLEVLNIMLSAIDSLPALKDLHPGDPVYDEAIEIAKDRIHDAMEELIIDVETDDFEIKEDPKNQNN
jgi:hypothetical protein